MIKSSNFKKHVILIHFCYELHEIEVINLFFLITFVFVFCQNAIDSLISDAHIVLKYWRLRPKIIRVLLKCTGCYQPSQSFLLPQIPVVSEIWVLYSH